MIMVKTSNIQIKLKTSYDSFECLRFDQGFVENGPEAKLLL